MVASQTDTRPHFAAVKAVLDASMSPNFAYALDKIPGTPQNATVADRTKPLPSIYVELGVEPRYVPPVGLVPASRRGGWRITTRCMGRTVAECFWAMDHVTSALRNGQYTVGGDRISTFFESGQQPEWDDLRFSALLVFTAAH